MLRVEVDPRHASQPLTGRRGACLLENDARGVRITQGHPHMRPAHDPVRPWLEVVRLGDAGRGRCGCVGVVCTQPIQGRRRLVGV